MSIYSTLNKPEKDICIYLLSDPDTNEPKYIGMTINGFDRIRSHYQQSLKKNKNNSYSKKWIGSLKSIGKIFNVDYLEYFDIDSKEVDEAEQFYINYFKFLGFKLINHENGGRWNGPLTQEQKTNISERVKKQMSTPEQRKFLSDINIGNKHCLGNKQSEESKFKTKSKQSHTIREIGTNNIFYGLNDIAKYLNCSSSKIRSYFKNDNFEIDNKKFEVLNYNKRTSVKIKEGIRKNSYQIEDHNGNLYTSVKEAAENIGCSYKALTHYVQGHTKTANGKTYKVYRHGELIKS